MEAPAMALTDLPLVSEMPVAIEVPASSASPLWIAAGVITLVVAAAGLFMLKRTQHARRVCHKCGATDGVSGDLCSACRHEAAEALRRAAAERVGRERAEEAQKRQQRERDEEDRLKLAQNAEQERLRQQELARKNAETAQALEIEARRGHLASAEGARRGGSDPEGGAFDPYAILGVAQGASPDDIRAAYEQAKAKYDLGLVEDLGFEIKEHYKARLQAVERAFQILTNPS
jgi:hypothetical protein